MYCSDIEEIFKRKTTVSRWRDIVHAAAHAARLPETADLIADVVIDDGFLREMDRIAKPGNQVPAFLTVMETWMRQAELETKDPQYHSKKIAAGISTLDIRETDRSMWVTGLHEAINHRATNFKTVIRTNLADLLSEDPDRMTSLVFYGTQHLQPVKAASVLSYLSSEMHKAISAEKEAARKVSMARLTGSSSNRIEGYAALMTFQNTLKTEAAFKFLGVASRQNLHAWTDSLSRMAWVLEGICRRFIESRMLEPDQSDDFFIPVLQHVAGLAPVVRSTLNSVKEVAQYGDVSEQTFSAEYEAIPFAADLLGYMLDAMANTWATSMTSPSARAGNRSQMAGRISGIQLSSDPTPRFKMWEEAVDYDPGMSLLE